ncbi:MAG TPA: dihydrodipicolinate synthase family protein [Albitalea sp.]|uniref:dihydrodipicolinate synthase family protein n=1 Tax=Piscinibacter sp. TaxID=1903157 RepID=UPI002ED1E683
MTSTASTPALRGIWPAMLTPLRADLSIDHERFAAHARALIGAGCAGVTPFGTTGEGPSFSLDERRQAVDALVAGGVPAAKILVSTSCAALPETLALTRHALAIGAWGCLMMPPFFLKGVSDQGVIDAYRQVIDGAADPRLRILLYHIPQVSGVGLSHEVIATLQRLYPQAIVGIKDSGCDRAHSVALAGAFMPPLGVHVGNEPDLPELARLGSAGAVSGLANFLPRLVDRLVRQPDEAATARDLERVKTLLALLGGYSLTPALKGIMAVQTGDAHWLRVRAPLVALDDARFRSLEREIRAFGIDPRTD